MSKHKIYYPPSLPTIGKFVQRAFDQLSEEDPTYARPEVRQGFMQFMWIASIIVAKHMSEADSQDNFVDTDSK